MEIINEIECLSKIERVVEDFESNAHGKDVEERLKCAESAFSQIKKLCDSKHEKTKGSSITEITNAIYDKKILVVDDDKITLRILQAALSRDGYITQVEVNPFDALSAINDSQPDVVILDLIMPQMTGFEFIQQVRSESQNDNIKIIVGSSRSRKEDIAEVFKAGANEYLPKPFNLERMNQIISEVLNLKLA